MAKLKLSKNCEDMLMKKNMKSIAGNFFYLFHELYLFKSSSILLPFLGSASQIFLSLIVIWIPKIILDLIESRADLVDLFLWIMITGAALLIASATNAIVNNCIDSCSQIFFFTRLKTMWEEKMMAYLAFSALIFPKCEINSS